ncbi:hypothetical protein H1R20_g995, partial [Candolleomyces eurysporus]
MSDRSNDALEQLTLVGARSLFANLCITMVGIGVHLFMALYGLSVFLETPKDLREGRRRYIALSFVFTLLASVSASVDMASVFQILFRATSGTDFYKIVAETNTLWLRYFTTVTMAVGIFVGDALLVYRCYMVLAHYRWVAIIPALLSVSAFVVFMVDEFALDLDKDRTTNPLPTVTQMLTVCTNILVTALISFHLYHARRALAQMLPSHDTRLYTGVVAILVESAVPLTLLGPITAALQLAPFPKNQTAAQALVATYNIIGGLFYSFCTLSPHMIIFRVTTGRSWLRFPSGKDSDASPISNPINFAQQRTAESAFFSSQHHSRSSPGIAEVATPSNLDFASSKGDGLNEKFLA